MHVLNTHGSYRRLLAMFGEVVLGLEAGAFEAQMDLVREEVGVDDDSMLTGEDMKVIVGRFKVSQYWRASLSVPWKEILYNELADGTYANL